MAKKDRIHSVCSRCGQRDAQGEGEDIIRKLTLASLNDPDLNVVQWLCVPCAKWMESQFAMWKGSTPWTRRGRLMRWQAPEISAAIEGRCPYCRQSGTMDLSPGAKEGGGWVCCDECGFEWLPGTHRWPQSEGGLRVKGHCPHCHHGDRVILSPRPDFDKKGAWVVCEECGFEWRPGVEVVPVDKSVCPACAARGEVPLMPHPQFAKRDALLECAECGHRWRPLRPSRRDFSSLLKSLKGELGGVAVLNLRHDGRRYWVNLAYRGESHEAACSAESVLEAFRHVLYMWTGPATSTKSEPACKFDKLSVLGLDGETHHYKIPEGVRHVGMGPSGPFVADDAYNHECGAYVRHLQEIEPKPKGD